MAAIRFGEEFSARYGQPTPHFFPGSLDQAIRESCLQPAKDVRHFNCTRSECPDLRPWSLKLATSLGSLYYKYLFDHFYL